MDFNLFTQRTSEQTSGDNDDAIVETIFGLNRPKEPESPVFSPPIIDPLSPQPGSTYTGAGPGGLPREGRAWKQHLSHKLAISIINHQDVNAQERCATAETRRL
jgi:hypothetical protein